MRAHACALVEVWKLRGGLPHAVESTALLTDAILHDDETKNSIFSIRATYSAAFCRFVTMLVDSKIQGKKRTMFQSAMDLGLPASFVELRHEATHRELPTLVVLRSAAQRSLEWLWDYYWAKIAESPAQDLIISGSDAVEEHVELRDMATNVFNLFTSNGDSGSKKPSKQTKKDQKNSQYIVQELSPVYRRGYQGLSAISQVLVKNGFLIPKSKTSENEVNAAFSTWDPTLKELSRQEPGFLTSLVDEMAMTLLEPREVDLNADPYDEALYMWLDHIFTSTSWDTSCSRYVSIDYVVALCKDNKGYWAGRLRSLIQDRSHRLETQPPVGSVEPESGGALESTPKSVAMDDDMPDIEALRSFGWDLQAS
ncbi:rRNA-processing protein las1 [Arachnomyces sp. PD_36]|nr:rRNA-processing protein las1 [Arachnomyces sp. PD_36]